MEERVKDIVNKFRIGVFQDPDISRLIQLTNSTYPGYEISDPEYLNWEYEKNPDGKALIYAAENGNDIVAQYVVLPRKYSIRNRLHTGSLSVNTLTHPDFKGQGLFPLLAEKTCDACSGSGIDFTIGFPNPASFPVFISKLKFHSLGRVPVLVKFINPLKILSGFLKFRKRKNGEEIIPKLDLDDVVKIENVEISQFDPDRDKALLNSFLEKFNSRNEVCTNRSADYLRWRYKEIPLRKYIMLKAVCGQELIAFAVLRTKYLFGLRCGILLDFCTVQHTLRDFAVKELFSVISRFSSFNRLDLFVATMQHSSDEYWLLRKHGYFCMPEKILPRHLEFILRTHRDFPGSENMKDFGKWFLTFGDYDVF